MPDSDNIDAMKIIKSPPRPRPKPKALNIRFYGEAEEKLLSLVDKTAEKAGLSREKFIKTLLSQALHDPKFILKVGE